MAGKKKVIDEERLRQAVMKNLEAARKSQPGASDVELLRDRSLTGPKVIYAMQYHDLYLQDTTKKKGSYEDVYGRINAIRDEMIAATEEQQADLMVAPVTPAPLWLEEEWSRSVVTINNALGAVLAAIAAVDQQRFIALQHDADAKVAAGLAEANKRVAEAVDEASESMEVACAFQRDRDDAMTRLDKVSIELTGTRDELIETKARVGYLSEALEKQTTETAAAMTSLHEDLKAAVAKIAEVERERADALEDRDFARKEAREERERARQAEADKACAMATTVSLAEQHKAEISFMETQLQSALEDRDFARKEAHEERERARQAEADKASTTAIAVNLTEQHKVELDLMRAQLKAAFDDRDAGRKEAQEERERRCQAVALAEQHKAEVNNLMQCIKVREIGTDHRSDSNGAYLAES